MSKLNFDDLLKKGGYCNPTCIRNILGNINNECLNGRQDAEEFLTSVLNALHQECQLMVNKLEKITTSSPIAKKI